MSLKARSMFFAVRRGRTPGVYTSWHDCEAQVRGFVGAEWFRCQTREDALQKVTDRGTRYLSSGSYNCSNARVGNGVDLQAEVIPDGSRSVSLTSPIFSLLVQGTNPALPPSTVHAQTLNDENRHDDSVDRSPSGRCSNDENGRGGKLPRRLPQFAAEYIREPSNVVKFDVPLRAAATPIARTTPTAQQSETSKHVGECITEEAALRSRGRTGNENMLLSEEQNHAVSMVRNGLNVFLTGCGGTGKSFTLEEIIKQMMEIYGEQQVGVTAMTGVAAENIGGCTLHSLLGIGIPCMKRDFMKMCKNRNRGRLRQLRLLIIDEVSMLSGEMLDLVSEQFQKIRNCYDRPFGGLQVVFSGDFYQLPPIKQRRGMPMRSETFNNAGHAFQSRAWQEGDLQVIDLKEVRRQSDETFILALADMREGKMTSRLKSMLQSVQRPISAIQGIEPTTLFCRNRDVDAYNRQKMAMIKAEEVEFTSTDSVHPDGEDMMDMKLKMLQSASFWNSCRALPQLTLKKGAQVMLLKNMEQTKHCYLVNGSRGVVEGFDSKGLPTVRFRNGETRSIGMTEFEMRVAGVGACKRSQIPLILAWAMSVHKSQGMSMDHLVVNLNGVFDHGQAYVALSRARFMDNLEVQALPVGGLKLGVDDAVSDFAADLREGCYRRTSLWGEVLS